MAEPPADLRDLLALHLTPGLGPHRIAALLERFGSAAGVLRASGDELRRVPGIGEQLAVQVVEALGGVDVEAELARAARAGVRLVALGGPGYPAPVATIPGAPHLLYVRGTLTAEDERAVALVGSRRCTDYGRRVTARLAAGLARAGVTVVSGLARGIDGAAHRAALQAGGRTLAVLAGGLSRIYPPEHASLADEVAAAGALLTESAMGQEPLAGLFPARNRLISGLCRAVVVVEAAEKSGALITAEHAAEQGRAVLAVPGPVDGETSGGCHALIRQGAALCRGPEDVLEEIDGVLGRSAQGKPAGEGRRAPAAVPAAPAPAAPVPAGPPPGLDEPQRRVWEFLAGGPRSIDELAQQLRLGVPALSQLLMLLEMRKVVRRLPGSRYERC
jgi:DNA processing protein